MTHLFQFADVLLGRVWCRIQQIPVIIINYVVSDQLTFTTFLPGLIHERLRFNRDLTYSLARRGLDGSTPQIFLSSNRNEIEDSTALHAVSDSSISQ